MRAVLQRVDGASVEIISETGSDSGSDTCNAPGSDTGNAPGSKTGSDSAPDTVPEVTGTVEGEGILALVGVTHDDGPEQVATLARKICELRILDGERSVLDAGAQVLVVSQFTLYGDARKGRRPSWSKAAPGDVAEPLIEDLVAAIRARGAEVSTGRFGAHMRVSLTNDGPFTILLEV